MTPQSVRTMLAEMDMEKMTQHSMLNHIIDGMHYLCLHRSSDVTLKLYLIEHQTNDFSGYLLHPHNHRYAFDTVVLAGGLEEIKFHECKGDEWDRHKYITEQRRFDLVGNVDLIGEAKLYREGDHYFNDVTDIHTLRVVEGAGPVLLGLMQFKDVAPQSNLYLPYGKPEALKFSSSRRPNLDEILALRRRCLEMII
ncbi:hypothetical protein PQQ87_08325 [Paraburkholderia nemoris]|uniref:hypothetical protein n=1 Tax=Paraburkholderia nemoris TaxID=2793076 RepID=UPI0038BA6207